MGCRGQTEVGLLLCSDAPPTLPFKAALNHRWLCHHSPPPHWEVGMRHLSSVKLSLLPSLPPSLRLFQLRGVPLHCLCGLRGIYSQLETLICSRSLQALEVRKVRGKPGSLVLRDMEDQALMFPLLCSLPCLLPPAGQCLHSLCCVPQHSVPV